MPTSRISKNCEPERMHPNERPCVELVTEDSERATRFELATLSLGRGGGGRPAVSKGLQDGEIVTRSPGVGVQPSQAVAGDTKSFVTRLLPPRAPAAVPAPEAMLTVSE